MSYVIRAVAFADDTPCPHTGQWLEHFDVDAFNGRGWGEFTDDVNKAKRFGTFAEAMAFWNQQSKINPLRPDGRPNKPLTALTAVIEQFIWPQFH